MGDLTLTQVPLDIFNDHDGIINDHADREHDCQQREQVHGKAEHLHHEHRADQRQGYGDQRYNDRAQRAQKKEDDDDYDDQGFTQRGEHFADGVFNVFGCVIRDAGRQPAGKIFLDFLHFLAHEADDVKRVGSWAAGTWP